MNAARTQLFDRFTALGIPTETVEHAAVHTVEDNQRLRGDLGGGHCKNLFLKDKKSQLWLVVAQEDRLIDMKDLKRRIGSAHLSFGKPDLLRDALGVSPGSVTPFGLLNDDALQVRVVVDEALMTYDKLNFHPLENTATTAIKPSDLIRFIRSCGHQVQSVTF